MKCRRCAGILVHDWFIDILDETGQIECDGWRCINCGNIEEPLILSHRAASLSGQAPLRGRARRRTSRARSLANA